MNRSPRSLLEIARRQVGGDAMWRARKLAEAADLVEMAEAAPPGRLTLLVLDLRENFRAALGLRVPVPLRPGADGEIQKAGAAVVGLTCPRLMLERPIPGPSIATLLRPSRGAWHPNIGEGHGQAMCLGISIPTALPVQEIVLNCYALLSMQNVMLDREDPAGVMNPAAADWWQQRQDLLPLTDTPFFLAEAPTGRGEARG